MYNVSRYNVVERIAARVMYEIRKNPSQSWEPLQERIKWDFAREISDLCNQFRSIDDGADLIRGALDSKASQIRNRAVDKMKERIVTEVESAPSNMALWNPVKESALRENHLAVCILNELGKSASDGSDLLDQALGQTGFQIICRYDVSPERAVKYVAGLRAEIPHLPKEELSHEPGHSRSHPKLAVVIIGVLCLLAVIATLLGLTLFDVLPIPWDIWPF